MNKINNYFIKKSYLFQKALEIFFTQFKYPYFYYILSIIGLSVAQLTFNISLQLGIKPLLIISRVIFTIFDIVHIFHHIIYVTRIFYTKNFCFALSFVLIIQSIVTLKNSVI